MTRDVRSFILLEENYSKCSQGQKELLDVALENEKDIDYITIVDIFDDIDLVELRSEVYTRIIDELGLDIFMKGSIVPKDMIIGEIEALL